MKISLVLLLAVVLGTDVANAVTISLPDVTEICPVEDDANNRLACFKTKEKKGELRSFNTNSLIQAQQDSYSQVAISGHPQYAEILRILVSERERRKPPRGQRSPEVYSAYLLSGQLEKAEAERESKQLDVPRVDLLDRAQVSVADKEAAFWNFDASTQTLHQHKIDLNVGPHIVVYAAPGCGICNAAATNFMSNEKLKRAFEKFSTWIETPDQNFSADYYHHWNDSYGVFPINAVFERKNWPTRSVAGTPVFLFLRDGKVVAETVGWNAVLNPEIMRNLETIGVN